MVISPAMSPSLKRRLLGLTLLALAVRVAFLLLEPHTRPIADERTWVNWATTNLLSDKVRLDPLRTNMIFYPPLYPYFIALPYLWFSTIEAVKWFQVVASALTVPAIGMVAWRAFGDRAAVVAAVVTAFYPELVWFSVHFWSETLFMLFLWWALERLLCADAELRAGPAVAAGLLWGIAILTRETVLYFTPLVALWLWWRRPGGFGRGAAFALCAVLVVAPWTWRNWHQFHAFVPVSTAGGLNLYQGNAPLTRQEVYDRYDAISGRVEQYKWAREQGLRAILDRQPWWIFEKLRDEMPKFWEADSLALIHIKRGAYGPVEAGKAQLAWAVIALPFLIAVGFFVRGLAALPLARMPVFLVFFLCFYNGLHVATHGFARYRLPVLPVVLIVAAWAFAQWRAGDAGPLTPWRRRLQLALAVIAALTLWPSLKMNLEHPAFGLTDVWGAAQETESQTP